MPVSEATKVKTGRRKKSRKVKGIAEVDSVSHETLTVDLDIAGEGYLYTYVSNESNWDVDVHFDQMQVAALSTTQPVIVQSNDYYPFGLTFNQVPEREWKNKYLYNGFELQDELTLDLYDY